MQGRFTSPDEFKGGSHDLSYFADIPVNPTFYAELAAPQSLNKYQYCLNNPLRFIDPDGHQPEVLAERLLESPAAQQIITAAGAAATVTIVAASGAAQKYWELLKRYPPNAGDMIGPSADSFQYFNRDRNSEANQGQQQNQKQGSGQSNTASPDPDDKKPIFGEKGTQTTSTTVYKGQGERIDVENPNPGQRPDQIHYQSGDTKLLYDPSSKSFIGASKSLNKRLMNDQQILKAINKGLKILGEDQ